MKKLSIILVCALVAMMSCKKEKEVVPEIAGDNTEVITVGVNDVHVEYTRTDHTELGRAVFHYCLADANGNAQQFEAAEMAKKETFFEITLNDLLSDTLYWYYYELFPNNGDAFSTDQKTFHTLASDTPEPPSPQNDYPEGAINGLFTINENGDQVYFSQGNLQYQASTSKWRFAEFQWDYVGNDSCGTVYENGVKCDNALANAHYNGWIDLYGWATSGYNHGGTCYYPWSPSADPSDYFAYGIYDGNLFDQTGQADWGYNPIINGGNTENSWRTLTESEWDYLLNTRSTSSGIRYTLANVNDVNGVVLVPDIWNDSSYYLFDTNLFGGHYSDNIISSEQWVSLEEHGAVFLPAAGMHYGSSITHAGEYGNYWSASCYIYTASHYYYYYASHMQFTSSYLDCYFSCRNYGESVRLVKDYSDR